MKKKSILMALIIATMVTVTPNYVTNATTTSTNSVSAYSLNATYTGKVNTGGINLNVRAGAGTGYSILGKLTDGTTVTIVDGSNSSWYKIKYGSSYGYVSKEYVSMSVTGYVSTGGANLNVRASANTSSSILGKLSDGSKITIVEVTNSTWYKIKYGSGYGYISREYVSLSAPSTSGSADINLSNVGVRIASVTGSNYNDSISIIGECVWYVRGRAREKGYSTYGITGNANQWYSKAIAAGASVSSNINDIKSNSILCHNSGSYGHVVYIEHVDTSSSEKWVYYTEANVEAPYSDGKISPLDGVLKKKSFNDFKSSVAKYGNGFQGYINLKKL